MTEALLSTSYFGPVGYYKLFNKYKLIIEANETYQKRSIRNRCQILSSNGPLTLSVPLKKGKTLKLITEVEIAYDTNWPTKHISAIRSAYGSAPYFEHYCEPIFELIAAQSKYLFDLNNEINEFLVKNNFIKSANYSTEYLIGQQGNLDYRNSKQAYLEVLPYSQVFEFKYGFTNGLSILDLIFNLGPESISILKT